MSFKNLKSIGLWTFCLVIPPGPSGTMKVQLLFYPLLWYLCPKESHIVALNVPHFCLQKTGGNSVEKPPLLVTRGAQCSVTRDFKKEVYCTCEDLHLCISATLTKMGKCKETVGLYDCWHITWHENVVVLLYWYQIVPLVNPCLSICLNSHTCQQPRRSQAKHAGRSLQG